MFEACKFSHDENMEILIERVTPFVRHFVQDKFEQEKTKHVEQAEAFHKQFAHQLEKFTVEERQLLDENRKCAFMRSFRSSLEKMQRWNEEEVEDVLNALCSSCPTVPNLLCDISFARECMMMALKSPSRSSNSNSSKTSIASSNHVVACDLLKFIRILFEHIALTFMELPTLFTAEEDENIARNKLRINELCRKAIIRAVRISSGTEQISKVKWKPDCYNQFQEHVFQRASSSNYNNNNHQSNPEEIERKRREHDARLQQAQLEMLDVIVNQKLLPTIERMIVNAINETDRRSQKLSELLMRYETVTQHNMQQVMSLLTSLMKM